MNIILILLAIYGLSFLVKQADLPFGIMAKIRNQLMMNKYIGKFVYDLLDCWFCTGCWSGIVIYLLTFDNFTFGYLIVYMLAGGAISLLFDAIISKLYQQS